MLETILISHVIEMNLLIESLKLLRDKVIIGDYIFVASSKMCIFLIYCYNMDN